MIDLELERGVLIAARAQTFYLCAILILSFKYYDYENVSLNGNTLNWSRGGDRSRQGPEQRRGIVCACYSSVEQDAGVSIHKDAVAFWHIVLRI